MVPVDCEQRGTLFTTNSNIYDVRRVYNGSTCLKDARRHDLKFNYYPVQNAVMMVYFAVFRIMSMDVSTCFKIFSNVRGMLPLQSTPDTDRRSPHRLSSGGAQLQRKGKFDVCAPSDYRGSGRRKNGFFYTCPKEDP